MVVFSISNLNNGSTSGTLTQIQKFNQNTINHDIKPIYKNKSMINIRSMHKLNPMTKS